MIIRRNKEFEKRPATSFAPDFIAQNVASIDFGLLQKHGIKTCFIDLDNTVVERGKYEISDNTKTALNNSGMSIYIATNRPKSRDLKDLKEGLGAVGVIHPHGIFAKPLKRYFINGLKENSLSSHEVVMIGDRYFQDILGSNRAGMYSLLVLKLGEPVGLIDRIISELERRLTKHVSKKYF